MNSQELSVILLRAFVRPRAGGGDVFVVDNRRGARAASCALVGDDGKPPVDGLHPDVERQGAREEKGRRHRDREVR